MQNLLFPEIPSIFSCLIQIKAIYIAEQCNNKILNLEILYQFHMVVCNLAFCLPENNIEKEAEQDEKRYTIQRMKNHIKKPNQLLDYECIRTL